MVEHSLSKRKVVGSSPACGCVFFLLFFLLLFLVFFVVVLLENHGTEQTTGATVSLRSRKGKVFSGGWGAVLGAFSELHFPLLFLPQPKKERGKGGKNSIVPVT